MYLSSVCVCVCVCVCLKECVYKNVYPIRMTVPAICIQLVLSGPLHPSTSLVILKIKVYKAPLPLLPFSSPKGKE